MEHTIGKNVLSVTVKKKTVTPFIAATPAAHAIILSTNIHLARNGIKMEHTTGKNVLSVIVKKKTVTTFTADIIAFAVILRTHGTEHG